MPGEGGDGVGTYHWECRDVKSRRGNAGSDSVIPMDGAWRVPGPVGGSLHKLHEHLTTALTLTKNNIAGQLSLTFLKLIN